jgi:CO/xanthine dehydrogenase Mo-binding subunit
MAAEQHPRDGTALASPTTTRPDVAGVGASLRRPDAVAKVRGEFEYAPDLLDDGLLWGYTLRSPHPRARIRSIDLGPAKAVPGVAAVLGAWDVPDNRHGAIVKDQQVLALDEVRYVGEPVALVAAVDLETARRAARAVVVDYEPLVPTTDALEALAEGKVYRHVRYTTGDPHVVGEVQVEGEYTTARQDHSFMAPDAGLARPDGRGGVEVIGATQWVHADRSEIASALRLPEEKVLVRNAGVGGSFGGRVSMTWQIHGALLAMHTERPVKMVYSRRETFHARYHRHPSTIWIRHHATRNGRLVKVEARIVLQGGPYEHTSAAGIGNSCSLIQGPYNIPNAEVEGWAVGTNNGMCGPLRGFGVVQPIFACESNMDRLAAALGMDPIELRRRNAIRQGDRWIFNQLQDRPAPVEELIEKCAAMPLPDELPDDDRAIHPVQLPGGVGTPTRRENVTRGVALTTAAKNVCLSEGAPVNSTALVTLRDGVATVECAAAEVGQGFVAVAQQIVQTVLGVTEVRLGPADTTMPPAATTDGSQQTVTSGSAVSLAATSVKASFLRFVAREFSLNLADLDLREGHVVDHNGNRLMTIAAAGAGQTFRATERFDQRPTRPLDDLESDRPVHVTIGFSANRCVVDVDAELGLVRVVQMDVLQDIGRIVNPSQAHGQVEGGSVMGMGLALTEHLDAEGGHLLNADWRGYHVPTIVDAPVINSAFVEYPEPGYDFGWKGIAELPHCQAPPSVVAAVRDATGLQLPMAPVTPDLVSQVTTPDAHLTLTAVDDAGTYGPWQVRPPGTGELIGPWRVEDA